MHFMHQNNFTLSFKSRGVSAGESGGGTGGTQFFLSHLTVIFTLYFLIPSFLFNAGGPSNYTPTREYCYIPISSAF